MSSLRLDTEVHNFIPILSSQDLKDCQQSYWERVEVRWRRSVWKVELTAEQLHAQQGKDQNEQEEKEQQ